MTAKEFVQSFKQQKTELLAAYSAGSETAVSKRMASLSISEDDRAAVRSIIDDVLTDAFYGILLGLDGAATLGSVQQGYTIHDEDGTLITQADDGELEGHAYEEFYGDPT